jgi:glycosyltransferase involved in cell wall biosynthesis
VRPVRVVHLIGSMDLGGAEKLTRLTIEGLDREEFVGSVCCLKSGGYYAEQLRSRGYRVDVLLGVAKDARNSLGLGLTTLWRLWRYLRQERPDVLHTHLFVASCLGRLLAPLTGVKWVVVTLHRAEYPRIQRWIERLLAGLTRLYVTDSHGAARMLSGLLGAPRDKVRVIYNGIDRTEFSPRPDSLASRQSLNLDAGCLVIGVIAHLYREKGHAFLFESLARAKPRLPRFCLLVVGDGYLWADLQRAAADLGLTDEVHFLGQRRDMASLLSAMDIFVLPSSWEGFGIALAEAMFMEVPVITTRDGGGCAEVVEEGDGGLLVSYGNRAELADALVRLAQDAAFRRSLGRRGRSRVERMFTAPVMVAQYAAIYRELTHSARPL